VDTGRPPHHTLRVVIAEDEDLIRKGLEREIPWTSLGMTVAGLASNGLEAAEMCRDGRADILITDIRMPLLGGLELIELVRRESADLVCLIISGYHDFSYAQKAISLGVTHYFLKPLELDQIEAKLREIADRVLRERRRSEDLRLRDGLVASVIPFVRRQFFLELIYGPYGDREIARQLAELGAVDEKACCAAVLIQAALDQEPRRDETIERRMGEALRTGHYDGQDIYLLRRSGNEVQFVAILLGTNARELASRRDGYLEDLHGLPCTRGTAGGGVRQGLARLHESFVEARKTLLLKTLLGRGGLQVPSGEVPGEPARATQRVPAAADAVLRIENAIDDGDLAGVEKHLDSLEASLPGPASPEPARTAAIIELFGALDRISVLHGIHLEDALRRAGDGAADARGDTTPQDVLAALKRAARSAATGHSTRRELSGRHLIDKARRYIESRFSSWDLTLEEVAEHVELNPSYFSTLFKSVTQVNYIDYLTGLRMEKARQLLEGTQIKIGAVAQRVGFQGPGYFGYLFKKQFGVTPSQFKAGHEGKGEPAGT